MLGRGLGNQAAKLGHGTMFFVFVSLLSCRCPPHPRPGGAARQGNLATHTVAQDCVMFIFFVMRVILPSLCYAFSARHTPPSRDCGLCRLCISCWFSPLFVSSPATLAVRGRVSTLVSLVIALAVSFNHLSPSRPPATLAARGRVSTMVCPIIAPAFSFICFTSRFSWLHSLAVQRCGRGF